MSVIQTDPAAKLSRRGKPCATPDEAPAGEPRLSVVLMTPDRLETQATTLAHLREQTIREQIEVIVVCPSLDDQERFTREHLQGFWGKQLIQSPPTLSLARQQAMGILAARAPVVALGEDHCAPAPEWAQRLVEAFDRPEGYVGVSPAVCIANDSLMAVGNQLIDYTHWTAPARAGEIPSISASNAVFRRQVIVDRYGEDLAAMIERGGAIHQDLREQGYRFYLEPRARTYHKNISRWPEVWNLRLNIGRFHAGTAADGGQWSRLRRWGRALLAPVADARRFVEIHKKLLCRGYPLRPKMVLGIGIGLVIDTIGQMVGYTRGAGESLHRIYHCEFHREPRMLPRERDRNYVAEGEAALDGGARQVASLRGEQG